jgi:transposase
MSQLKKNYPNPEVSPKPQKRKLSPEYKRRILEEAAACEHGELGALLRREGLYYSSLAAWRKEVEAGTLGVKKRGRPSPVDRKELKRLEAENSRLKLKLEQAEAIIEAQKKLARLLESLKDGQA